MPAAITSVNQNNRDTQHRVIVNTSADDTIPTNFFAYRLYRSSPKVARELVAQRTTYTATYTIDDYTWTEGSNTYEWVRVTSANSVQTETVVATSTVTISSVANPGYWLVHATDRTLDATLPVTGENFTPEVESSVMNLIGRGRKVDRGDYWGIKGSLTLTLRKDAAAKRTQLEKMGKSASTYHYFTPFGDRYKVSIDPPSFTRVQAGAQEFLDATIEYYEVV